MMILAFMVVSLALPFRATPSIVYDREADRSLKNLIRRRAFFLSDVGKIIMRIRIVSKKIVRAAVDNFANASNISKDRKLF